MKISIKGLAIALGVVWGVCILIVALANMVWPTYGAAFLDLVASLYPGMRSASGVGGAIIGALYGLVDGAIAGAIFAWIYNKVA